MKDFLAAHGLQAGIVLFLMSYNILGTALSTVLDKVEAYLTTDGSDPKASNPKIESAKAFLAKSAGYASSIVDWLVGNKEH